VSTPIPAAASAIPADDDPAGHRQERKPSAQWAVAEDLLHVQGGKEEHPEQARRDQQQHHVGHGKRPDAEDAEPDQRGDTTALNHHERRQQHEPGCHQSECPCRTPAEGLCLDDRVHEHDQTCGNADRARQVK
jgi:hypothetical protein